jgi:transposase
MGDVALGQLRRQIRYQADWAARQVMEIDRFYPSSRRCLECGTVNGALGPAKGGEWPARGVSHDRDGNAAKNIRAKGRQEPSALEPPPPPNRALAPRPEPATAVRGRSATAQWALRGALIPNWRSLRDSNPCYSLERAMSWASRRRERWGA